jgi:hypothetical protein
MCTYCLASVAKLNGTATAFWGIYADHEAPTAGLIFGTPKIIRSDEWVGETPWILSQAARRFAVENPGVGDGVVPLLNNLPARHRFYQLRYGRKKFRCRSFSALPCWIIIRRLVRSRPSHTDTTGWQILLRHSLT